MVKVRNIEEDYGTDAEMLKNVAAITSAVRQAYASPLRSLYKRFPRLAARRYGLTGVMARAFVMSMRSYTFQAYHLFFWRG